MKKLVALCLVFFAVAAAGSFAQKKPLAELLIFNNWSSDAEIGALNVIRNQFQAEGGKWADITIAHNTGADIPLINMITGGNPPDVFINNNVKLRREFIKRGLLADLTDYYKTLKLDSALPQACKDVMAVDGQVVTAPLAVHIVGTIFWNTAAAKKAGVDPKSWKNLDAMFADFPKIRKAGIIPLAIGAQPWQLEYLLGSCIVYYSGSTYDALFGLNPSKSGFDTPEMRQALALFRRIQQESDPGAANRNWNDTTAMVIRGDALMQFHGDWMKGEFAGAKKKIGVDYDTMLPPGTKGVQVTIDAETFLKPTDAAKKNSEELFFNIMLRKDITERFSIIKGSTPVRLDASAGIDKHAKMVLKSISDPKFGHPVRNITMDDDFAGAYMSLADQFWNTPSMTGDEFIKELQQKYDEILGK
ncbi:MAG TPA: ABC transporter substrate-binding protein [Spirochaetia bacterium]|nr:ABC transporter substrate-binding protein [Spirochaetia bacterium]